MWTKRSESSASGSSNQPLSSLFSSLVGRENLDRTKAALSDAASKVQNNSMFSGVFKSAMDYIGTPNLTTPGQEHALVGTSVEINGKKYKIRSLLAEGGFALVFSCQDSEGRWYALKRLMACDAESANAIIKEIQFLKELSSNEFIIDFVAASQVKQNHRVEYLLLTEFCSGGPLIEVLQREVLRPEQILQIFYAVCAAVHSMHDRAKPITHRDLKIENMLFDGAGRVKLCDFGSATTEIFRPDDSWTALRRTQLEEDMQRFTTPMYRAPEILDTYQNYPIGPPQDVWALGCILAYLCYRKHPFEDSAKLRIINAKYSLPQEHTPYSVFHPLIESMLQPDPYSRPTIGDLIERLEVVAVAMGIDPRGKPSGIELRPLLQDVDSAPAQSSGPPPRPAAPPKKSSQPLSDLFRNPFAEPPSAKPANAGPPPADDFFSSLGWSDAPRASAPSYEHRQQGQGLLSEEEKSAALKQEEDIFGGFVAGVGAAPPVPKHHAAPPTRPPAPPTRTASNDQPAKRLTDLDYERMHGIRVSEEPQHLDEDADKYKFDYEIGERKPTETPPKQPVEDPFDLFGVSHPSTQQTTTSATPNDLLGDWPADSASNSIGRNASAPQLNKKTAFDPFAEFLAANGGPPDLTPSAPPKSTNNSGRSTPMNKPHDKRGFDSFFNPQTASGAKFGANAFDDLLGQHGFESSTKNSQRSLADMKRAEEIRDMDPDKIKIRDWTKGKERNIRALLGSLTEVLWEGQHNWSQPSMGELLTDTNVKKYYRKACLVVHPDKQTGQPHESLARAIFTELNDAWNEFEHRK